MLARRCMKQTVFCVKLLNDVSYIICTNWNLTFNSTFVVLKYKIRLVLNFYLN